MQTSGIKIDLENSEKVLFDNAEQIEKVLQFAVRQVVISHQQAGKSLAVWKDEKAVLIMADEVKIDKIAVG